MVRLWFLAASLVVLPGCTTWDDLVAAVDGGWTTIICWVSKMTAAIIQAILNTSVSTINNIAAVLPTMNIPQPTLDSQFISNIAFFVPISEMATVAVTVFSAVFASYAVFVVLRWLKIIR